MHDMFYLQATVVVTQVVLTCMTCFYLQATVVVPQELLTRTGESCPCCLGNTLCHRVLMTQMTVCGNDNAAAGCRGDVASSNRHLQHILQRESEAATVKRHVTYYILTLSLVWNKKKAISTAAAV